MKLSGPNFLLVLVVGAAVLLFGGVAYKTSVKPIPGQQPLEEIQDSLRSLEKELATSKGLVKQYKGENQKLQEEIAKLGTRCDASSLKTSVSGKNFVIGEVFRSASGICRADIVCEEHFELGIKRGIFPRFEADVDQTWKIVFPTLSRENRKYGVVSLDSIESAVWCKLSVPDFTPPHIFHDAVRQKYVVEFRGIPEKFKFIKLFSPDGNVADIYTKHGLTDCQISGSNIEKK
eukprot:191311_1